MFAGRHHILLLICFLSISFNFTHAETDIAYIPDYTVLAIHYLPDYSLLNKEVLAKLESNNAPVIPASPELVEWAEAGIFSISSQAPNYEIEDLIEEEDGPMVSQSSSVEIPDPFSTWSEDSSALDISKPLPTSLIISRFIFDPAGDDDGKEFIELRNESDSLIYLAD